MFSETTPAKRGGRPPKSQSTEYTRRELPPELIHFNQLPRSAHVRLPVVRGLYGNASPSTIWRWVRKGAIPQPVKLGMNISAWRVGDLRDALGLEDA